MDVLTENITTDPCFASEKLGCARIRMANLTRDNFFLLFSAAAQTSCVCLIHRVRPDKKKQHLWI